MAITYSHGETYSLGSLELHAQVGRGWIQNGVGTKYLPISCLDMQY
jgi:hypothetical protein